MYIKIICKQWVSIVIKCSVVLVLFVSMAFVALAQTDQYVQIAKKNPTINEIFKSIGRQTKLNISYDQNFDLTKQVSLPENTTLLLNEIMAIVLKDSNREYVIVNGFILIKLPLEVSEQDTVKVQSHVAQVISDVAVALNEEVIKPEDLENAERFVKKRLLDTLWVIPDKEIVKNDNIITSLKRSTNQQVPINSYLKGVERGARFVAPSIAVKTNILSLATTTFNIGVEVLVGEKITIDFPIYYNAWTFKDNKKWRHLMIKPEVRWWKHEAFNRSFIGAHLIYTRYNIGNVRLPLDVFSELQKYRYQGSIYGIGASFGYQWVLSERFNVEAVFGFGYAHIDYIKKECYTCGNYVSEGVQHYFGPTRLGLSLAYILVNR